VNPKISSHATLLRKAIHKAVIAGILSTASLSAQALDAVAYYSDRNSNQVFIVDPRNMLLVDVIDTIGDQPYPIDKVGNDKVYVSTRNSNSLDIIDYDGMTTSFSNTGIVPLQHKARSVDYNSNTNLALVSGVRKALMSVIDVSTDTVVGVVGEPDEVGSGTITGHPFWVDDDQFLLLDLARNLVHLYKIEQKRHRHGHRGPRNHGGLMIVKQDTLRTPSPVHHFSMVPGAEGRDTRTFYGMAEGISEDGIRPAVLEIFVSGQSIRLINKAELEGQDASIMGSHHLGMHPDGMHIYAGSKEGHTFVIDRHTMSIVKVIDSGSGSGHTTFDATANVAIETNHTDTSMTLMDSYNHVKLGDISNVAGSLPTDGLKSQSHTSSFDPQNPGFFYTATPIDGNLIEIHAVSGIITNTLPLDSDGYIIQGTYDWNLGGSGSGDSGGDM
jgi:hypothetical protein